MEYSNYQRVVFLILLWSGMKSVLSEISCSFEQGWCGWKNEQNSTDFIWKSKFGQTEDHTSGPLNDHTCKNIMGKYIYISGHDVKRKGSVAVFKSATFSLVTKSNLTFWYSMNGVGIGKLALSRVDGKQITELWSREGRQGRGWIQGSVQLQPGKLMLQFSAGASLPYSSDLAIDDIQLASESHVFDKKLCKLTTTTSITTTPTTTVSTSTSTTVPTAAPPVATTCPTLDKPMSVLPGSCDFEKNLCNNVVSVYGSFMPITWTRTNKQQLYGDYRINGDHTKALDANSTGYYLKFENGFPLGNKVYDATIETPLITINFVCLTFWYNLPSNYSNLHVSVKHNNVSRELWKREETIKRPYLGWHNVTLTVHQEPPYSIIFQSYNKAHMAYVFIDDILIFGANISAPKTPVRGHTTTEPYSSTRPVSMTDTNRISSSATNSMATSSNHIETPKYTLATQPLTTTTIVSLATSDIITENNTRTSTRSLNSQETYSSNKLNHSTTSVQSTTLDSVVSFKSQSSLLSVIPTQTKIPEQNVSATKVIYTTISNTERLETSTPLSKAYVTNFSMSTKPNTKDGTAEHSTAVPQVVTNLTKPNAKSSHSSLPYHSVTSSPSSSFTSKTSTVISTNSSISIVKLSNLTTPLPNFVLQNSTPTHYALTANFSKSTNAIPASKVSLIPNTTLSHKSTVAGTITVGSRTTSRVSFSSPSLTNITKTLTEYSKGTKKKEFISTTEPNTKKPMQVTKKTDKSPEDELKQLNDKNSDNHSLSSVEIVVIAAAIAAVVLICSVTVYSFYPKLKRYFKAGGTTHSRASDYIYKSSESLTMVNGKSEYINGTKTCANGSVSYIKNENKVTENVEHISAITRL